VVGADAALGVDDAAEGLAELDELLLRALPRQVPQVQHLGWRLRVAELLPPAAARRGHRAGLERQPGAPKGEDEVEEAALGFGAGSRGMMCYPWSVCDGRETCVWDESYGIVTSEVGSARCSGDTAPSRLSSHCRYRRHKSVDSSRPNGAQCHRQVELYRTGGGNG
jgi:hypothetical protein